MPSRPSEILKALEALKFGFGGEAGAGKHALLSRLQDARLPDAGAVLRLHELLCFWRAYPDDPDLLRLIEKMLAGFADRPDLGRHRTRLADSGVEGTEIRYEFFMQMAQWVAERWPGRLHLDWKTYGSDERIQKILNLLALYSETPGLDEFGFSAREWIDRLRGPDRTDAVFLVERIANLPLDSFTREYFYEHLELPMVIRAGTGGPSRTRARLRPTKVAWQKGPLDGSRPDLPEELRRPPERVFPVPPRLGRRIIDLARESMLTRSRDLDVFAFGDPRDVRIIDCGQGLQFAAIGAVPERRLMFEAVYGFLTFKNGVPIGYVLNSALFNSVEVAYNVFETYRGGEAGMIYGRLLAALRHLFAADTFTVYPYQLGGEGNQEGLESGAWWFYQKLGFRARDAGILALMRRELARMKRNRRYRSSLATLEQLGAENVYYDLGPPRQDVIGRLPLGEVGLRITDYLSGRFGSRRHEAAAVCGKEAMKLLGVRSQARFTAGERLSWARWAPLVLILPGVKRWSAAEKRDLVEVVRAKGSLRESEFVTRFDRHRKLRRAMLRLAEESR